MWFVVDDAVVMTTRSPSGQCDAERMFTCRSGACISKSLMCNGEADCVDASDEGPGCQLLTPQTGMYACGSLLLFIEYATHAVQTYHSIHIK